MNASLSVKTLALAVCALISSSDVFASGDACQSQRLRISAGGDVLIHESNYKSILNHPDKFYALFAKIQPLIRVADISYLNLEGAIAKGLTARGKDLGDVGFTYDCDGGAYCGNNFVFNYHPRLVTDLKKLGVDVVSMANNHVLDRGSKGIDRGIEALRAGEIKFAGIRKSGDKSASRHTTTTAKGWTIAWVSCTEHTNGMPDKNDQVLMCAGDEVLSDIRRLAKDKRYDAVIVTPHWGPEYQKVDSEQIRRAKQFVEAGATIIIGNHPHVLQKLEVLTSSTGRKVPVAYSLGNFIAGQDNFQKNLSVVLYLDLVKDGRGETQVESMSFAPIFRNALPTGRSYQFLLAPVESFDRLTFFEKENGKYRAKQTSSEQAMQTAQRLLAPAKMLGLRNLPRPTGACK